MPKKRTTVCGFAAVTESLVPDCAEEKKPKKKKWLKYAVCILLLVALAALTFWYLLKDASLPEVFKTIKSADPYLLLLAVAFTLGYVLFEALGLFAVMRSHGNRTRFISTIKYAAADFYFCGITPSASGGQPVVAVFMAKDGVSVAFSTIVLLLSTATFKMVLVLLSLLSLFFISPMIFASGNVLLAVLFFVGLVINVLFILFCLLLVYKPSVVESFGRKTLKFLHRIKIVKNVGKAGEKLDKMLESYREGAEYAKSHFGVVARMFLYTLIQRVLLFSVGYVVAAALGAKSDYFVFMSIQAVIATAVDSMPFPGGVGLSETMFKRLYSLVYTPALMMPALLLTRGISFYLLLTLTGLYILIYCVFRLVRGSVAAKRKEKNL